MVSPLTLDSVRERYVTEGFNRCEREGLRLKLETAMLNRAGGLLDSRPTPKWCGAFLLAIRLRYAGISFINPFAFLHLENF